MTRSFSGALVLSRILSIEWTSPSFAGVRMRYGYDLILVEYWGA